MNVKWSVNEDNPTRHYMRVGLLRAVVIETPDGNLAYTVYVLIRGQKAIIHRVSYNPVGPHQVNAYIRCEHIVKCYDKFMGVKLLPIEEPDTVGTIYQPKNIPAFRDTAIVSGITIGGVYEHIATNTFYTVTSVANSTALDQEKWPTTVVYRNLVDSETYCRPLTEFTHFKYRKVNIGECIDMGLDFYVKISRLEAL